VYNCIYDTYNNDITGPVTQQKRMNHPWITHIFSARSVRRMRNSSVDRTWTLIDCKWMCVAGYLCVIWVLRYSWVGVRSLCVEYAWLYAGHASAVSAYASELVRSCALHVRPLTLHLHITHNQRTYHVHSTDIHWLLLTKRRRARYISDSSVVVNDTCALYA